MSARRRTRPLALLLALAALLTAAVWTAERPHGHVHATEIASKQLWTCGMHPEVIRDEPGLCPICHMKLTPLSTDRSDSGAITIDPVVVQNMGVRVAEARMGPLTRTVRAVGYLAEAEPNVRDVSLRVSGWIETLQADTVGMHVQAGAPLFELYSPEVQVAVEELIAARRGPGGGLSAEAGAALGQATRRKLERFGLRAADIDRLARLDAAPRTITVTSPITGHVTEKLVVAGSAVKAGERVLQIVDHSTLWLDVQVHPQDLPLVVLGSTLTATIDGVADAAVTGEVIFVHPHVDATTRTATVRARVPNPDLTLRPGMYATARLDVTSARAVLQVPREAVIDTGERQLAFVAVGIGTFEPRAVAVGAAGDDGMVEIVRGVAAGERVVTSGQFLLDAESRMREAVQKHLRDRLLVDPR